MVETCNATTVKAVDETSVHRAQLNRMAANQAPINQTWSYQAQPSYLRGGQQGNNGRGQSYQEGRRCYVCGRLRHLARDCRDARGGTSVEVWHAETRGTITIEIIIVVTIETMVIIVQNIGLHIDIQMVCVPYMTTNMPRPTRLHVVGHVGM